MAVEKESLNDSGMVTEKVSGSNTGGLRSASTNDAASGPLATFSSSVSTPRAVSASISANGPVPIRSPAPKTSKRLNSRSRRLER